MRSSSDRLSLLLWLAGSMLAGCSGASSGRAVGGRVETEPSNKPTPGQDAAPTTGTPNTTPSTDSGSSGGAGGGGGGAGGGGGGAGGSGGGGEAAVPGNTTCLNARGVPAEDAYATI